MRDRDFIGLLGWKPLVLGLAGCSPTVETGSAETGTAETGSAETGAVETGSAETGDTGGTAPGDCPGETRPHLAYAWWPLADPAAAPSIASSGNYRLAELGPREDSSFDDAVWSRLSADWAAVGEGRRALILRADSLDTLPHAHPDDAPFFWDAGTDALAARITAIATEMSRRGLAPDRVFLDFEWGLSKEALKDLSTEQLAALAEQPAYAEEIAPLLDAQVDTWTGEALTFSGLPSDVLSDPWTLTSYQWNRASQWRVRGYYRRGLVEPLVAAFPDLPVSNYADWRPGDAALVPDLNGHAQHRVGFNEGEAVAGTRASVEMYGRMGMIVDGWNNNPDADQFPTAYPATPGNALRLAVRGAASAVRSGDGVDLWVAHKEWDGHPALTPLGCPALVEDPSAVCSEHWEESILHGVLLTDAPIIWWGGQAAPASTDIRLQRVLDGLDRAVGCADRRSAGAVDAGWDSPMLVSGMHSSDWTFWRVTATAEQPPDWSAAVSETAGGAQVSLGGATLDVPSGQVWEDPVSAQGIWFVQPVGSAPPAFLP